MTSIATRPRAVVHGMLHASAWDGGFMTSRDDRPRQHEVETEDGSARWSAETARVTPVAAHGPLAHL